MTEQVNNSSKYIKITGVIALCYYLFAAFFPKALWGGHHISFLPIVAQIMIFLLTGYFILIYPSSKRKPLHETILKPLTKIVNWKTQLLVSICFGILFYVFPIHTDTYGDASYLFIEKDFVVSELSDRDIDGILSFNYTNPKIGTETTLSLISLLSYSLKISSNEGFIVWDSLWGIAFIFLWLKLIGKYVKNESWKVLLTLTGCTGSFLQLYFGHFEIYAPVFTWLLLYFFMLLSLFEAPTKKKYIALVVILIFCLKFHVTSFLLLPSFVFTSFLFYQKDNLKFNSISPKWIVKYKLLPASILGIALYLVRGSFIQVRQPGMKPFSFLSYPQNRLH